MNHSRSHEPGYAAFAGALEGAEARGKEALQRVARQLREFQPVLFGYGGKGRTLALHIGKTLGQPLAIVDTNPAKRAAAARDGFETFEDPAAIDRARHAVILAACQAQDEQARIIKSNFIYFQEAAHHYDAPHLAHRIPDFADYVSRHKEALFRVYLRLAESSRPVFLSILRFRLSLNPADLAQTRRPNADMWFDVLESHGKRRYQSFVDVGAFDGDTLAGALRRLKVERGIAIEANTSLHDAIAKVAQGYSRGITTLATAAWSHACRLRFQEVRDGMVQVEEACDGEIEATTLDSQIHEPVDLVKMDIEGAEDRALSGLARLVRDHAPDLAIAAYHRPSDFVDLFDRVDAMAYLTPSHQVHVGHYSDCIDDSIFYFVGP